MCGKHVAAEAVKTMQQPNVWITCRERNWFEECYWLSDDGDITCPQAYQGQKFDSWTCSILVCSAATCEIPVHSFLRVAGEVITEYHFLWLWKPIFWVSGPHQRTDWVLKGAPSSIRLLSLCPGQWAQCTGGDATPLATRLGNTVTSDGQATWSNVRLTVELFIIHAAIQGNWETSEVSCCLISTKQLNLMAVLHERPRGFILWGPSISVD